LIERDALLILPVQELKHRQDTISATAVQAAVKVPSDVIVAEIDAKKQLLTDEITKKLVED